MSRSDGVSIGILQYNKMAPVLIVTYFYYRLQNERAIMDKFVWVELEFQIFFKLINLIFIYYVIYQITSHIFLLAFGINRNT